MKKEYEYTIEEREGTEAHGIAPPSEGQEMLNQINTAIELNELAKKGLFLKEHFIEEMNKKLEAYNWPQRAIEILQKNILKYHDMEVSRDEIIESAREVLRCNGWHDVVKLVQDDHCADIYILMQKYVEREGQPERKGTGDDDFIDTDGFGHVIEYLKYGKKMMQLTFDAKYALKGKRPLHTVMDLGIDLSPIVNKVHPDHYTIPQGHKTKSECAVKIIHKQRVLDKKCSRMIKISSHLFGYGRDGNGIHVAEDSAPYPYID